MKTSKKYGILIGIVVILVAFGLFYGWSRGNDSARETEHTQVVEESTPAEETSENSEGKENMSNALAISTADFDKEVLQADTPVLVDFWAPWCMPCRMLAPTIDELATEFAGKVKIVKVNVDDNQPLASKYAIRGIPTLMVFKNGESLDRLTGVQPKTVLAEKLNKALED